MRGLISASAIIGKPVKSSFVSTRAVDFGIIIDQGMCVRVHSTYLLVCAFYLSCIGSMISFRRISVLPQGCPAIVLRIPFSPVGF